MRVYLDHNATTPLRAEARDAWLAAVDRGLGNPSSLHRRGRLARQCIDDARERIAAALGVHEEEIVFTSGGTEAIHLAVAGHLATRERGAALASPGTEHAAVRECAAKMEERGHPHRVLRVDGEGELDPAQLRDLASAPELALVALSAGNHEAGTVHDLGLARQAIGSGPSRPILFADGVQALGRVPLDIRGWGIDLAAFSAHKVGGPLGLGVLFARRGIALAPLRHGGAQERGLRPGTEDAPSIAAAAVAIELAVVEQAAYRERVGALARDLWDALRVRIPGIHLAGPPLERERRLPNTLCVLLPELGGPPADGKMVVMRCDLDGLEVSAGSACASGSLEPSPVLLALGHSESRARSALRLSLGRGTRGEECQRAADILVSVLVPSHATRDGADPL